MKIEPNLQMGSNEFLYVESKRARLDREKVSSKINTINIPYKYSEYLTDIILQTVIVPISVLRVPLSG